MCIYNKFPGAADAVSQGPHGRSADVDGCAEKDTVCKCAVSAHYR